MNKDNKGNGLFIIVLLAIVAVLVFLFPKIYGYIESINMPKVDNANKEETKVKEVTEEVINSLHFPLMRNSIYNSNTYYSLDKFSISNMSNSDILLNAFLDMYEGNITNTNGAQFNQDYIGLRVSNILGKDLNYTLENFEVPEDASSNYKGLWVYDASNSKFIYNGYTNIVEYYTSYYNLEELIKAEYDDNGDIIVYYYVGFAKVEGNNYIIYSDANMTKKISSGIYTDIESLNSAFKSISKSKKNAYKYIFKDTLCSYGEYCLYSGEWTHEF